MFIWKKSVKKRDIFIASLVRAAVDAVAVAIWYLVSAVIRVFWYLVIKKAKLDAVSDDLASVLHRYDHFWQSSEFVAYFGRFFTSVFICPP